jgi:hypothetical protein
MMNMAALSRIACATRSRFVAPCEPHGLSKSPCPCEFPRTTGWATGSYRNEAACDRRGLYRRGRRHYQCLHRTNESCRSAAAGTYVSDAAVGYHPQRRHIPTIAVGNIYETDHVNSIIAAGRADLVCLARPHLADPNWTLHAAAQLGYKARALMSPTNIFWVIARRTLSLSAKERYPDAPTRSCHRCR